MLDAIGVLLAATTVWVVSRYSGRASRWLIPWLVWMPITLLIKIAALSGVWSGARSTREARTRTTSPSNMTHVLALHARLALARRLVDRAGGDEVVEGDASALMTPVWTSVWITPAASGAVAPLGTVQRATPGGRR